MSWRSIHRRDEVLRHVIAAADVRRDGRLPMDITGVSETFAAKETLLAALQLRWHVRLAARITHELAEHPCDRRQAVVTAWQGAALEMPGILAIVDARRARPVQLTQLNRAVTADLAMMAVAADEADQGADDAPGVGLNLERLARAGLPGLVNAGVIPPRIDEVRRVNVA